MNELTNDQSVVEDIGIDEQERTDKGGELAEENQSNEVQNSTKKLFKLEDMDMDIFMFILNHIQITFIDLYPKALNNLLNKILVYQMTQFINN